jgi:hypothetical protein
MREPEALVGRARRVYQTGGLIPLIRQGLRFVSRHLFEYGVYYLARAHTEGIAALDEADFVPKVDDFSLRIVATNEARPGVPLLHPQCEGQAGQRGNRLLRLCWPGTGPHRMGCDDPRRYGQPQGAANED